MKNEMRKLQLTQHAMGTGSSMGIVTYQGTSGYNTPIEEVHEEYSHDEDHIRDIDVALGISRTKKAYRRF